MAGSFPIFAQDGFRIGIGDANRDGRLDFDFGVRADQWGGGPHGWGRNGAEIGFNTDRGAYFGTDYERHNGWGSEAGYGRVFGDGGYQAGHAGSDAWGNYHAGETNASPWGYHNSEVGGNTWSGNYYGSRTDANGWGAHQDTWGGNTWTGGGYNTHQYGDVFGNNSSYGRSWPGTPPFVPPHGGGRYGGGGCGCVSQFMMF